VNTCSATGSYSGPKGCPVYTLKVQEVLDMLAPFIGALLIVFGGFMTFAGAKFVPAFVSILVGILVDVVLFSLSYNLFFQTSTGSGVVIGVLVFTTLLGCLAVYFAYRVAKGWATAILGAWAGIAIGVTLIKLFGVENIIVTLVTALLFGALGVYVGKKYNRFIRSVGTAIIGSFLLVRGIGSYAGGYPGMNFANDAQTGDAQWTPAIIGYAVGTVVFAIVGSIVQGKLFKHDDDEDQGKADYDMMKNEDEGKKCGCF